MIAVDAIITAAGPAECNSAWNSCCQTVRQPRCSFGIRSESNALQQSKVSAIVDFDGTWDSYLASKSKKIRHEIKRSLRRVFESGRAEYIRFRPAANGADPRWDLFNMCEQVAAASWQAQASPPSIRLNATIRDTHAAAVRYGIVDLNLLIFDSIPAAFSYNYHHRGELRGVCQAYDLRASGGFGKALLLRSIEDSFARGDRSLNLGALDSRLKAELQTRFLPNGSP